jgi:integrase/recombinase XerD
MSALSQAVQDYLEMRRALGYKLTEHGRVLPQFVEFLEQREAPLITTALALEFATQPTQASVVRRHQRLAIVRGFAIYVQAFDARHEVPPVNLLPATFRRAIPYLYSEAEIEALMQAARGLRPALRAATCETLIGLLSVTGMRIAEACGLDRSDVELAAQRLTVRRAKNGRSREIPLHPSTVTALEGYARAREELCPDPIDRAFFLSSSGARLSPQRARASFDQLRRATGLDRDTLGRHARVHDIRHTFVLRTLLSWYREDSDIEPQLPLLSTFMGHVEPANTYWYFEGTPELLALAAERLERTWEGPRPGKDDQ